MVFDNGSSLDSSLNRRFLCGRHRNFRSDCFGALWVRFVAGRSQPTWITAGELRTKMIKG